MELSVTVVRAPSLARLVWEENDLHVVLKLDRKWNFLSRWCVRHLYMSSIERAATVKEWSGRFCMKMAAFSWTFDRSILFFWRFTS